MNLFDNFDFGNLENPPFRVSTLESRLPRLPTVPGSRPPVRRPSASFGSGKETIDDLDVTLETIFGRVIKVNHGTKETEVR